MYEHPSNLPGTYDRHAARPGFASVLFREERFLAGADINEAQSIQGSRLRRIGNMTARDGDRVDGATAAVDIEGARIILTAGKVYAAGDVRSVPERILEAVALAGDVSIGIRLATSFVTDEDDPALKGLHPGSLAEGEPCAAREVVTATWSLLTLDEPGDYYQVYLCRGGTIIDQTPPPALSGITQALAQYDRGSNGGNYITSGCRVTALGASGGAQSFSIEEGEANIFGFKRVRQTALRHVEPIVFETEDITAEPHIFEDGGSGTASIKLNSGPIDAVTSVIVSKRVTETIVRGSPNNTADPLGHSGAHTIVAVVQGATSFVAVTDYTLSANAVNWAPAGAEPAVGSSYNVTYDYYVAVAPDAVNLAADTITLSGAVTNSPVTVAYRRKLPRIDRLCLDSEGGSVYLRGTASRSPWPPQVPTTHLALASIYNDWRGTPAIVNDGTRNVPFEHYWRTYNAVLDALDLIALERLHRDIDSREPVAKRGVFVDPFANDYYRDQGEAQSAALFGGTMQLAIDPTLHRVEIEGPIMLPWIEEVVISQPMKSDCMKINPYSNFTPMPGRLTIKPAMDFWTEHETVWTSPVTEVFETYRQQMYSAEEIRIVGYGSTTTTSSSTDTRLVDQRAELLEFLRPISIAFTIDGFGPGENLTSLTFDGVSVTPPGLVGNAEGRVLGSFNIPPKVTAGTKIVEVVGGSGTRARAQFVGQGTIDIAVMQRVTTTEILTVERVDPLAQTWALPEPRHVVGINLWWCAIGDPANPVAVDLVNVDNGVPTRDILSSCWVMMTEVTLSALTPTRWRAPIFLPADREMAHVVKTDDNIHALSIARVGGFDAALQQWVGAQPYSVGVLHSSSNASSWTAHQDADMTFEVVAAKFTATERVVELGTFDLLDCSDLVIRATVEIPTADCSFHFELVRASGEVLRLLPDVPVSFTAYVTETVTLRAVLRGTAKVSPTLWPGALLIAGKLRATGTYVSRAMSLGAAIRHTTRVKAFLPAGSTATVEIDKADDVWSAVPVSVEEVLNDGWRERTHTVGSITGAQGRIRLTIAGTPAARPVLSDLRCVMV